MFLFLEEKNRKNLKMIQKYPVCERSRAGYLFGGRRAVMRSLWFAVVGGSVPNAPRRGQDPPTMQRIRGGNGKVEGRACPAPTDCRKRLVDERGKGGRQPLLFPLTVAAVGCGRHICRPYSAAVHPCGGSGALGGAQRAPPASKAGPLVRLFAPQGANIARSPSFAPLNCGPALATPQLPTQKWRKAMA